MKHGNDGIKTNAGKIIEHSSCLPFECVHNVFHCFYCYMKFYDVEPLREHTKEHIPQFRAVFKRLQRHAVKIDISDLTCRLCGQSISDMSTLKSHLQEEHQIIFYNRFNDGVLPFRLTKQNDLFSCHLCSMQFHSFYNFNKHMNTHFKNYICETCGNGFVSPSRLLRHRQVHDSGSGTFPCDACGKEFNTSRKQKTHVEQVHERKFKLKCPQCPLKFMEYHRKLKHLVEVHGAKPMTFKCDLCNRVMASRRMLTIHTKRDHLKELPHGCDYCGKQFFFKSVLIQHITTHTGEKNFECVVCKKSFAHKKFLMQHMRTRTHTDNRPFVCNACGKTFMQNSSLKKHLQKVHQAASVDS